MINVFATKSKILIRNPRFQDDVPEFCNLGLNPKGIRCRLLEKKWKGMSI
jgi:hypothetical protein